MDKFLPRTLCLQQASILHDHIYAYYALFDPKVQQLVEPDYTKGIDLVYREFAYGWMFSYNQADLLLLAVGVGSNQLHLQSWVPDFSQSNLKYSMMRDHFFPNYQVPLDLSLTSDGLLGLRGFHLDRVVASRPDQSLNKENPHLLAELVRHEIFVCRNFYGLPSTASKQITYAGGGDLEDAFWRTLFCQWMLFNGGQKHTTPKGPIQACKLWFTSIVSGNDQEVVKTFPLNELIPLRVFLFHTRHLFLTQKGYIGISSSRQPPKVGDDVFLLASQAAPFILRPLPIDSLDRKHKVVSESYIDGVMAWLKGEDEVTKELFAIDYTGVEHSHMKLATSWETVWLA